MLILEKIIITSSRLIYNINSNKMEHRLNTHYALLGLVVFTLLTLMGPCCCEVMQSSATNQAKPTNVSVKQEMLKEQDCKQSFPRLFFTEDKAVMLVKFNTREPCIRSFVTVVQESRISKFYCESVMMKIVQNQTYIRFIQNCKITINNLLPTFSYSVFGQPMNSAEDAPGRAEVDSFTVHIPHESKQFNMIVTADWGPMQKQPFQPIYPSLLREIRNSSRSIHALLIMGDVAYNLNTNNGKQYELFMSQLSLVSPFLPIIPIFGNHESDVPTNFEMFKLTFETYELAGKKRVQSYQFWNFKLVVYNPFLEIYGLSNSQEYEQMRNAVFAELAPNKNRTEFKILASHYPLMCSQDDPHCRRTMASMPDLFKQISDLREVDLYLGAHMHQYERIVPYIQGNFSIGQGGPYYKGEMPSIVEGVAGCDVGIIDQDYPVMDFSVAHSYNRTGYGVISIRNLESAPSAEYIHYITPSSTQTSLFDSVSIFTQRRRTRLQDQ